MSKPNKLKAGMSQLLAEGADAKNFCIWACVEYGFEHIEVQDFGGIKELGNFLEMIRVLPNYNKVPAILIVRDAETNPEGAIQSVKTSLKKIILSYLQSLTAIIKEILVSSLLFCPVKILAGNIVQER